MASCDQSDEVTHSHKHTHEQACVTLTGIFEGSDVKRIVKRSDEALNYAATPARSLSPLE